MAETPSIGFGFTIEQDALNANIMASDFDQHATYRFETLNYVAPESYSSSTDRHVLSAAYLADLLWFRNDYANETISFGYINGVANSASKPTNKYNIVEAVDALFTTQTLTVPNITLSPCTGFTINHTEQYADIGINNLKSYNSFSFPAGEPDYVEGNITRLTIDETINDSASLFCKHYTKMLVGTMFGHPNALAPLKNEKSYESIIGTKVTGLNISYGKKFADILTNNDDTVNPGPDPTIISSESGTAYTIVRTMYEQLVANYPERFDSDEPLWVKMPFQGNDVINFNIKLSGTVGIAEFASSGTNGPKNFWEIIPNGPIKSSLLFRTPVDTDGLCTVSGKLGFKSDTDAPATAIPADGTGRIVPPRTWKVMLSLGASS